MYDNPSDANICLFYYYSTPGYKFRPQEANIYKEIKIAEAFKFLFYVNVGLMMAF
jgi:hypothetical protein